MNHTRYVTDYTALSEPRMFTVRPGLNTVSSDGVRLGLVDRMFLHRGTVIGFLVACGRYGRRHKHLGFDVVDHLEGETILLSINEVRFHALPDLRAREMYTG